MDRNTALLCTRRCTCPCGASHCYPTLCARTVSRTTVPLAFNSHLGSWGEHQSPPLSYPCIVIPTHTIVFTNIYILSYDCHCISSFAWCLYYTLGEHFLLGRTAERSSQQHVLSFLQRSFLCVLAVLSVVSVSSVGIAVLVWIYRVPLRPFR